jgi:hypothetical protein
VMVHEKSATSTSKFINVPVGALPEPRHLDHPSLCVDGAPLVYYINKERMIRVSFPRWLPNHVQNKAKGTAGCNMQGMFHRLQEQVFQTELKFLSQRPLLPPMFDWKKELKDNMIMVALLEGSDGPVHHAVTMFQGWILDSNETHALPLTKQALDFCTQTDKEMMMTGCPSSFSCFKHGTIYTDTTKLEKLKHIAFPHGDKPWQRQKKRPKRNNTGSHSST